MMRLPNFETEKSISELQLENNRLLTQADKMLDGTKILDVLAEHGRLTEIGGSYKYRRMTYPDIDIGLLSNNADKHSFSSLVADVVQLDLVYKTATVDTDNFLPATHPEKRPKGYWLGIEIPFEGDRWGIDCWYQHPDELGDGHDAYADRLSKITDEQRDAILSIKYELIRMKKYGTDFTSGDVYDAVLNGAASDIGSFLQS